jgi:predicted metal-dependent HD superfamily phosphohydrolase
MVSTQLLSMLSESWQRIMDACQIENTALRHVAWLQIVTGYSEPHRYYHTLEHVSYVLDGLSEILHPALILPSEEQINLRLAVWYHDIVYDTHRHDNEERSSELARNALGNLGVSEDRVARICELIEMTKHHQAPANDFAAQWFLDADLSILGGEPEDYATYTAGIRKEYGWVAEYEYYSQRRAILHRFLQRPWIFLTATYQAFESDARANITAEIAQIDAKLHSLAL